MPDFYLIEMSIFDVYLFNHIRVNNHSSVLIALLFYRSNFFIQLFSFFLLIRNFLSFLSHCQISMDLVKLFGHFNVFNVLFVYDCKDFNNQSLSLFLLTLVVLSGTFLILLLLFNLFSIIGLCCFFIIFDFFDFLSNNVKSASFQGFMRNNCKHLLVI